jgi:glycosyltransferase involved in cell wall biosynthesis
MSRAPWQRTARRKIPRVSVLMPVYNSAQYFPAAIESILNQTFHDFEVVVVDDHSQDGSWDLARAYARKDPRVRVWRNPENWKLCKTLNRAIGFSRGEFLARMDSDDISLPERLARQVAFLKAHPEVGICGGTMEVMDAQGRSLGSRHYALTDAEIRKRIFRYSPFSHPTVMFRRRVLEQAGLYNPQFEHAEDYELYFRLGRLAKFGNLPDTVLRYRQAETSVTTAKLRIMESRTLQIRLLAAKEYGYPMSFFDKIYWILQWGTQYLMPAGFRVRLFNRLRGWSRQTEGSLDPVLKKRAHDVRRQ